MPREKEDILQHENLRDFLEWSSYADEEEYYDRQEKRLTELAEKFGVTPLQMGQLDFSLVMIDYEMKLPDDERTPYVEVIHSIAQAVGDEKTKDIIHNWLLERVDKWHTNLVPSFSETTTLNQALMQTRGVTKIYHGIGVDAAFGMLSSVFHEVEENNPLKKDQTNN